MSINMCSLIPKLSSFSSKNIIIRVGFIQEDHNHYISSAVRIIFLSNCAVKIHLILQEAVPESSKCLGPCADILRNNSWTDPKKVNSSKPLPYAIERSV